MFIILLSLRIVEAVILKVLGIVIKIILQWVLRGTTKKRNLRMAFEVGSGSDKKNANTKQTITL